MTSKPTQLLTEYGVSIWLDDLSRSRIESGNLAHLVSTRNVTGVTTNPSILQAAISGGNGDYALQLAALAGTGASADEMIFAVAIDDVRAAADILRPVFDATGGVDGRVSIEVSPDLAHDTEGTIAQALTLWNKIDRPNILIKIPATDAGLPAITATLARGISVNVTLIFGLERYAEVIDAYFDGLESARTSGIDLAGIHSVASFFVSRVDSEVDRLLHEIAEPAAHALTARTGVANACLAYELHTRRFASDRGTALRSAGANVQRPLWASTGVKSDNLPDTHYVTELVGPGTVNTMPAPTLEATYDHAVVTGDTLSGAAASARRTLAAVSAAGVDIGDVARRLEAEGVSKFVASWRDLQRTVDAVTASSAGHHRVEPRSISEGAEIV